MMWIGLFRVLCRLLGFFLGDQKIIWTTNRDRIHNDMDFLSRGLMRGLVNSTNPMPLNESNPLLSITFQPPHSSLITETPSTLDVVVCSSQAPYTAFDSFLHRQKVHEHHNHTAVPLLDPLPQPCRESPQRRLAQRSTPRPHHEVLCANERIPLRSRIPPPNMVLPTRFYLPSS